jgi:hypothetical protein
MHLNAHIVSHWHDRPLPMIVRPWEPRHGHGARFLVLFVLTPISVRKRRPLPQRERPQLCLIVYSGPPRTHLVRWFVICRSMQLVHRASLVDALRHCLTRMQVWYGSCLCQLRLVRCPCRGWHGSVPTQSTATGRADSAQLCLRHDRFGLFGLPGGSEN